MNVDIIRSWILNPWVLTLIGLILGLIVTKTREKIIDNRLKHDISFSWYFEQNKKSVIIDFQNKDLKEVIVKKISICSLRKRTKAEKNPVRKIRKQQLKLFGSCYVTNSSLPASVLPISKQCFEFSFYTNKDQKVPKEQYFAFDTLLNATHVKYTIEFLGREKEIRKKIQKNDKERMTRLYSYYLN